MLRLSIVFWFSVHQVLFQPHATSILVWNPLLQLHKSLHHFVRRKWHGISFMINIIVGRNWNGWWTILVNCTLQLGQRSINATSSLFTHFSCSSYSSFCFQSLYLSPLVLSISFLHRSRYKELPSHGLCSISTEWSTTLVGSICQFSLLYHWSLLLGSEVHPQTLHPWKW